MMHGYKDFPLDVRETFNGIIQTYGFQIVSESDLEVVMKSENCIVLVMTEYDYADFLFKRSEDERWIFLGAFVQAVYPEEKFTIPTPSDDWTRVQKIECKLQNLARLADRYCHAIFNGDFSLIDKYETKK